MEFIGGGNIYVKGRVPKNKNNVFPFGLWFNFAGYLMLRQIMALTWSTFMLAPTLMKSSTKLSRKKGAIPFLSMILYLSRLSITLKTNKAYQLDYLIFIGLNLSFIWQTFVFVDNGNVLYCYLKAVEKHIQTFLHHEKRRVRISSWQYHKWIRY